MAKLPRGNEAIVDRNKVRDYLLSPTHPRGRHKARVFLASLDLDRRKADVLLTWLQEIAGTAEALPTDTDRYGTRWTIEATMKHGPRIASVRSVWLVRTDGSAPRLITAFVV